MKFKKILLISIFLLVMISITAVSAIDENMTSDEVNVIDESAPKAISDTDITKDAPCEQIIDDDESEDILSSNDDETVKYSENDDTLSEKKDIGMNVIMPSKYVLGENGVTVKVTFEDHNSRNFDFLVDGQFIATTSDELYIYNYEDEISNLGYGIHKWEVKFNGDSQYNPISKNGTFEYTYINTNFPKYIHEGDETFDVNLPSDAKGNILYYIDNKLRFQTQYIYNEYESLEIELGEFDSYGKHTFKIVHSGDSKYHGYTINGTCYYTALDVYVDTEIEYGTSATFDISLPEGATGTVEILINGKSHKYKASEYMNPTLSEFIPGANEILVKYSGDKQYSPEVYETVIEAIPVIKFPYKVAYCDDIVYSLQLPKNATGSLVLYYDDVLVGKSKVVNGKAVITLSNRPYDTGSVLFKVFYNGTDYYVEEESNILDIEPKIILPTADSKTLSFQLPSNATGTLTVKLNGKNIAVDFKNGKALVNMPSLQYGNYYNLEISYSGNYPSYYVEYDSFEIDKATPSIKVNLPSQIFAGTSAKIVFTLPSNANGMFYIETEDDDYYETVSNGKATVSLTFSKAGTYNVNYEYNSDDVYADKTGSFTVVVISKGKIMANALNMIYSDGSAFKVRVLTSNGKSVGAGKTVTFKIKGKKHTAKTDKNGYASFKPTNLPGTYYITVSAQGITVTKKLTVKQILKLKKVSVKKSAKKVILKATLSKVKGKYLKGKKITFKFKGKKYTAKTNKKGIAKVKIKKSVLKKLKAGKKITYTATYLKDTVKKTVKVKK